MVKKGQFYVGLYVVGAALLLGAAVITPGCRPAQEVPFSQILQVDANSVVKSADYTIVIANEGGEYVILPGDQTQWKVYTGTTIQFINETDEPVKVTASPDVYQGADPFIIDSGGRTLCVVDLSHLSKEEMDAAIKHHFEWATWKTGDPPRMVTGGPKMVPTEPQEQ